MLLCKKLAGAPCAWGVKDIARGVKDIRPPLSWGGGWSRIDPNKLMVTLRIESFSYFYFLNPLLGIILRGNIYKRLSLSIFFEIMFYLHMM